jgi:hypothetical protein
MFPAYDAATGLGPRSGDNPCMSMDLIPGPILNSNPGCSRSLPGLPTVSHPLNPGPYHKANAQLRKQLPHYNVAVKVTTRWDHIFLWLTAVLVFLVYFGVRLYYLVSGKTAQFEAQNTSVVYSYVVLAGETACCILGFYGHQLFWKQGTNFTAMEKATVAKVTDVRCHLTCFWLVRCCQAPSAHC